MNLTGFNWSGLLQEFLATVITPVIVDKIGAEVRFCAANRNIFCLQLPQNMYILLSHIADNQHWNAVSAVGDAGVSGDPAQLEEAMILSDDFVDGRQRKLMSSDNFLDKKTLKCKYAWSSLAVRYRSVKYNVESDLSRAKFNTLNKDIIIRCLEACASVLKTSEFIAALRL